MTSYTPDVLHLLKSALRYIASFITDQDRSAIGKAQPSLYDIKMYYRRYHTPSSTDILDAINFLTDLNITNQPLPNTLIATIIKHRSDDHHQQPLQHLLDQVQHLSDNITDTEAHTIIGTSAYVSLPHVYYFYQKQSQQPITIDHDNIHINRYKEQLHRCRQLIYPNPFSSNYLPLLLLMSYVISLSNHLALTLAFFTMNLTLALATFTTIIVVGLATTDTITDRSNTDGRSTTVLFARHGTTHGNNINAKDLTFNPLCLLC